MSETDIKTTEMKIGPRPAGRIRQTISNQWWVRAMRFIIAAVSVYLLYHIALRFGEGRMNPTDSWLIAMVGTLGLSALVEAIWPDGNHGLLQFWCLTTLAAAALVSWVAGGAQWLGIAGAALFAISFALAVMSSAKGSRSNAP